MLFKYERGQKGRPSDWQNRVLGRCIRDNRLWKVDEIVLSGGSSAALPRRKAKASLGEYSAR